MEKQFLRRFIFILTFILTFISCSYFSFSQECGFGAIFQAKLDQNPNLLNELAQSSGNINNFNPPEEYIIPVVVHIIHSGGPENISDAQVFRAIEILNEGFRGDYDPDHLDTKIRFQLAQTDPKGCATNGIMRVFREVQPCIFTGYETPVPGVLATSIINWPSGQFFNIWVVNCFDHPAVAAQGDYSFPNNPSDGIVIRHDYFGDIGTAVDWVIPSRKATTIIHEMGHAFGLQHIWGPDLFFETPTWFRCHLEAQGDINGDFVSDTPPQETNCCDCLPENSCQIETPDKEDDIDNLMSYKSCRAAFTQGQNNKFIQPRLNDAYNKHWSPVGLDCAGLQMLVPNKDIEIIQNTNWTTTNLPNGGEITMDRIVVKPGATLTIGPGVVIHFRRCTPNNLVVERDAKLILHGKLTNSLCDPSDYWYGIEVAGVNIFQGAFANPGEVHTEPGSVIENAEFGIRNRALLNSVMYSGGKVFCNGTNFLNNRIGVRFYHWFNIDKPNPGPWGLPEDDSEIENCAFKMDGNVLTSLGGKLIAHIYMEGIRGISIKTSIFENTSVLGWKGAGVGIYGIDAGFDIEGDGSHGTIDFKGLTYGIQTLSNGSGQPFTVKKCAFHENSVGIYNRGVSNATITFNTFSYAHDLNNFTYDYPDQIGIYLEGLMTMIDIQENDFFDNASGLMPFVNTIGICSNNLGGFTNIIRRNTFDRVTISNIANGVNSNAQGGGLLYQCNENFGLVAYDIALTEGASIRSAQDGPLQLGQPSSAGNKFAYFNLLLEDDINNAGAQFAYRYNPPTPKDEPKEVTVGKVVKLPVPGANLCTPEYQLESPPSREQWQSDFQNAKTAWQSVHQQYLAALDGGNTLARVSLVENASYANISAVMSTLSSSSPWVSERVFRTLISKYPLISTTSIRNLIMQNPDVLSDGGFWIFLQNSGLFSPTDMQAFTNASTTATTARTLILQNMASHKAAMDYWSTLYLNDYLHEHPGYTTSFFETFMQGFDNYSIDALRVEELLRNGNLTQALNLVNTMGTTYCITSAEIAQHAQYQQLVQVMANAFLSGRSLYEFNTAELAQIGIIHQTSSGLAKLLSGNILHSAGVLVSSFAACVLPDVLPEFQGGGTGNRENSTPVVIKPSESAILCYPNPAGDFVQFDFTRLAAEIRRGQITIYDLMGKIIAQKPLYENTENLIIDTRDISDGIYLYQIAYGKGQLHSGKFIVKR